LRRGFARGALELLNAAVTAALVHEERRRDDRRRRAASAGRGRRGGGGTGGSGAGTTRRACGQSCSSALRSETASLLRALERTQESGADAGGGLFALALLCSRTLDLALAEVARERNEVANESVNQTTALCLEAVHRD
jgi:hypothetical protein